MSNSQHSHDGISRSCSSAKPKSGFKINRKSFFLTYSQCPLEKELVLDHFLSIAPVEKACIAQEHHADDNFHIHAAIWFEKNYQTRSPQCFDIRDGEDNYHPNISERPIRSKKAVLAYLTKDDVEPLEYNMSIKEEQQARANHTKIIGKRLIRRETTIV